MYACPSCGAMEDERHIGACNVGAALATDAGRALLDRLHAAEAQLETSRAEFAVLMGHSTRNVQILNDISMQTCCVHFERLPEAVRELAAELHAAEVCAKEDEQLRLRLAGDLAMEQHQHELAREQLTEVYREVDGLRTELASVNAGVCQSCASAWWAREHDQNAAKEQVAAAETALRAERVRASVAQVATNAAVRDLTSAAGEITLLREKLAAAEAKVARLETRTAVLCDCVDDGEGNEPFHNPACSDCHGSGVVIVEGGE